MEKSETRFLIYRYFNLYVLISFLGWIWETAYLLAGTGILYDRGFLTLPLCPIYATVLLGMYFIAGTLSDRRGLSSYIKNDVSHVLIYLCLCFILPTIAELLVGVFFLSIFNLRLWDYSYLNYNYGGHIALEISTLWALGIFIFMNKIFPFLKKSVFKLNEKSAKTIACILASSILIDLIICVINNM